ncbi:MAG: cobamide remodeling phosphodiesterase CbiR, partial [Desulfatirhabdiaceae bacterium]
MPLFHQPFKHCFPFRLGTTSFIFPDDYIPNVQRLAPFLDEIEILVFESDYKNLPSANVIRQLSDISRNFDLGYNVHLPVDVSIADPSPIKREQACQCLFRVFERMARIEPSTWTLHIDYSENRYHSVQQWQDAAHDGLMRLVSLGVDMRSLSVENLFYPVDYLLPLAAVYDFNLCLDIGHALLSGMSPFDFFDTFRDRISIIHLHGVRDGKDHLPLDMFLPELGRQIIFLLQQVTRVVSVEV